MVNGTNVNITENTIKKTFYTSIESIMIFSDLKTIDSNIITASEETSFTTRIVQEYCETTIQEETTFKFVFDSNSLLNITKEITRCNKSSSMFMVHQQTLLKITNYSIESNYISIKTEKVNYSNEFSCTRTEENSLEIIGKEIACLNI